MPGGSIIAKVAFPWPDSSFRLGMALFLLTFSASAQSFQQTRDQFAQGNYESVVQTAQQRARLDGSPEWQVLLVKTLLTLGRYDEAHTNVQQALRENPFSLRLLLMSRQAALFANDIPDANRRLVELRLAIERRGAVARTADDLVSLGEALLQFGVEPRIVLENCFRRAQALSSPPREAYLAPGQLALDKHDYALAADTFREGLRKFPEDPDFHWGLAAAFEPSDREQMLNSIQAALKINPRHIPSLLLLADHLIDAEQYDEANQQLDLVLKINPHHPEAWAYRAILAHLRNDSAAEQRARDSALASWKSNPNVDYLIGLKLSRKYRFTEGAAAQRRALAFDSDYLPAQRQLAEDLLRLGENEEGWKLAETVHSKDEYDVNAYNLATLHDRMAKFESLTNEHFIVRMASNEAKLYGDRVLALLERARQTLSRKYGLELTRRTAVEIFPEQKDFSVRTFGMPGNPGYLGVCFGSVITANSPASQAPNPSNWEDVLWHEFCHVITLTATKNRMPRWLSEGISVYEERQADPSWGERMNLDYREMILKGELTPLSKLSGAFLTPKTPQHLQFAYFESSLVVEFIVEKFGLQAIKNILADLRDGKEINESIASRTIALSDLEKQFADYATDKAKQLAPNADLALPPEASGMPAEVWERIHSSNYHVQLRKAIELMQSKEWGQAKPILETLTNLYAGESGAENPLWLLAVTQRNLNETNAELSTLKRLAERDSEFVELYTRLIELSRQQQDWRPTMQYAERLLAVNPLISLPYRALAEAGMKLNQRDQAVYALRRLLLLDPADPADVHFQLARLLHERGDATNEARLQVLQALEEAPRYRDAQKLLLQIVQSGGNQTGQLPVQPVESP